MIIYRGTALLSVFEVVHVCIHLYLHLLILNKHIESWGCTGNRSDKENSVDIICIYKFTFFG